MKKLLLIVSIFLLTTQITEAQKPVSVNSSAQAPILRFYPNPATSVITFDFQKAYEKGYSLQIYNFMGRKMVEQNNLANQTTIYLTDFTRGVYVYQLRDKTGKLVESGKFQVSK